MSKRSSEQERSAKVPSLQRASVSTVSFGNRLTNHSKTPTSTREYKHVNAALPKFDKRSTWT